MTHLAETLNEAFRVTPKIIPNSSSFRDCVPCVAWWQNTNQVRVSLATRFMSRGIHETTTRTRTRTQHFTAAVIHSLSCL